MLGVARTWWCAPLLCTIVALGMLTSTPTFGAPDSAVNLATGWYDIHHLVPTQSRTSNVQLGYAGQEPCYAHNAEQNATCQSDPRIAEIASSTQRIANYPPPYYWVIGAAELVMSPVRPSLEGDAARVIGMLLCLALLFLAAWRLHRANERTAIWALYLLTPPMAAFLFAGANPNGWEIACALFFTATLLCQRAAVLSGVPDRRSVAWIAFAALLFATARPSGGGWMVVIAVTYAVWFRLWRHRRTLAMLGASILPAALFTVIWNREYPWGIKVGQPALALTFGSFITQVAASFQDLSTKVTEVWGVLGWLDTWPSSLVLLGVIGALIYYLPTYAPTRAHRGLLAAIIGISFIASSVLEGITWRAWPTWWQGRYTLTLLVGLSMLLFSDPGRRERPGLFALAGWVTLANAYMVCLNYWRYEYGITNGIPAQFSNSGYGLAHSLLDYAIVVVIFAAGVVLLVVERVRRGEDLSTADAPEPQIRSLDAELLKR